MSQLFKNRAISILQATINSSATSLTVEAGKADRFPVADTGTDPVNTAGKDWFKAVLRDSAGNWEIVYVRTRALGSAVLSNVQRAQEGTTAIGFAAGSIVRVSVTAEDIEGTVAHPNDDSGAHAASAISNTPSGNIAATTVQAAINELDTEKAAASHTHTASQITDLQEAAEDIVGNLLTTSESTGDLNWTYTDGSGTLNAVIKDDAVTFAKMQNIATNRLLGRATASSGNVEELTIGTGLALSGGALVNTVQADFQQFDASGTWTKPSGFSASALVIMEAWGTGGGGGNGPGGSGGGGGGYIRKEMLYSEAASSYAITIVAGAVNTAGGNTTVGSILTAYGGGRGRSTAGSSGGGGGGAISAGSDGTSSAGAAGAAGGNGYAGQGGAGGVGATSAAVLGGFDGGGGGGAGAAPSDSLSRDGATGCYGGGGGGGGGNSTNQAGNGANSYWGGAGGAGDSSSGTDGSAGTSVHGGNGGGVNTAGAQPGGGGGGGSTGGAGGTGRVRITVIERT